MKVPILPALVLSNVLLAGLMVWTSAVPDPGPPRIVDTVVPSPDPVSPAAPRSIAELPTPTETTMFGSAGFSEKMAADVPAAQPSQPGVGDISLLGVLIAQQEGGQQAVVSLLRHGSPPVVSRLTLGGTVDGWKLVSATRTTVTLSAGNGTTRVLHVGAGAKDRAPR